MPGRVDAVEVAGADPAVWAALLDRPVEDGVLTFDDGTKIRFVDGPLGVVAVELTVNGTTRPHLLKLRAPVGFDRIRSELGVPGAFPPAVQAEADAAAARPLPDVVDLRDVPFVTLDPEGCARPRSGRTRSRSTAGGYRCPLRHRRRRRASSRPAAPSTREAHVRGRDPLPARRPRAAAPAGAQRGRRVAAPRPGSAPRSCGRSRSAPTAATVRRASSERSCAAASSAPTTTAHDPLLQEVGEALERGEARRGGVSLDLPEQEVVRDGDRWRLTVREIRPIEGWNEQLSLLAGRSAAALDARRRRRDPADDAAARTRSSCTICADWHGARHRLAEVTHVRRRGARRRSHRRVRCRVPAQRRARPAGRRIHGVRRHRPRADDALGGGCVVRARDCTPATARRSPCQRGRAVAICDGDEVPRWARAGLAELPETMDAADRRAHEVDRAVIDQVEALLLSSHVGAVLDATVVSTGRVAVVAIADPVVVAPATAGPGWSPGDAVPRAGGRRRRRRSAREPDGCVSPDRRLRRWGATMTGVTAGDLDIGAFRPDGEWVVDPDAMPWRRGVDELRARLRATACRT